MFGRTAQHHSSEVSVDLKILFSETEVLAAMESADVFARRLIGDHLRPPVCTRAPEMEVKEKTFQLPSAHWVSLARDRWVRYSVGDAGLPPPIGVNRDSASACVGSVLGLDPDTFRTVGA